MTAILSLSQGIYSAAFTQTFHQDSISQLLNEENFFLANGQQIPVEISSNQIGILLKDGVNPKQIEPLSNSLGLKRLKDYPGGIMIFDIGKTLDRASLVKLARQVKKSGDQLIAQAGLVTTPKGAETPLIVTDEFIVQFKADITKEKIAEFNRGNFVEVSMENPFAKNQFLLKITDISSMNALGISNAYAQSKLVQFAHPNFVRVIDYRESIPSDRLFNNQWHHRNTGLSSGTPDADVDTSQAWDITTGSANTVIAVIDDGFDLGHPDLAPNFWVNRGEIAGNLRDDDGNGFVDDINGWDFVGCDSTARPGCGDRDPSPGTRGGRPDNHGTSVAGTAAARGNNGVGVSGSCQNCTLMLIRQGNTDFADGLAFGYAQQAGAQIITNSWGYPIGTPIPDNVVTAINNAATAGRGGLGSVVLFAMNNLNRDDCVGATPDISSLTNVIAVSASSNQDQKVTESAFGTCMDVVAPTHRGYGIFSVPYTGTLNAVTTDRVGNTGYNNTNPPRPPGWASDFCPVESADRDYTFCFGGTSFATPLTGGIIGLTLSVNPDFNRLQTQQLLQDTADKIQDSVARYDLSGFSSTHGRGRVNAFEAVRIAAPVPQGKGGVDIFVRDNRLDWGNTEQPSNTLFEPTRGFIGHWQSADIKIDAGPDYQTAPRTSRDFEALVDENPVSREVNRVYVRVRNRGPVTATSGTVKLYWMSAGTALPRLPSDFWSPSGSSDTSQIHPLGNQPIRNLAYSGSSIAGTARDVAQIFQFNFPGPELDLSRPQPRHYCLLAIIDSPQDSVSPTSRASFVVDDITPNDNNVTHRNLVLEDPREGGAIEERFFVRNPTKQSIQATLRLDAPKGWKIELDKFGFNQPFDLKPNQEILVTIKITPQKSSTIQDVIITQERIDQKRPMGGITYRFRALG
ncbi:S8 family serine peptidase [Anabaena sp. UHCC 0399]|uniref:S8 family serine peptidase n=1 Tax=Anabaena sp. UHCC 0399 TaxID=3110238 RepID=UPI002B2128FB|nr:S8 family serine peptidase [Anabaena sp. UHCC 0399]MEA5569179.1 S8 family serine peptidase [Anabaena sp. UHCC 0399]